MPIPIPRIIDKLDSLLAHNDIDTAARLLVHWEDEARACSDTLGLITILNEEIGFYRRNRDEEKAIRAVDECLKLLDRPSPSHATILVNIGTTLSSYGREQRALEAFKRAGDLFKSFDLTATYEYAAFLNNRGTLLASMGRNIEALDSYNEALEVLKPLERKIDIALTYANIADITPEDHERLLDLSWEAINGVPLPRGGEYAFAVTKLAPCFRKFGREVEASALEEVAKEIYEGA